MSQSLLSQRQLSMRSALVASTIAHGAIVLAVLFHQYFAGPRIDLNKEPIRATLVRKGKPREADLLPRKEELPPPPKAVAGPPAPAATPPTPAKAVPVPGIKPAVKKAGMDGQTTGVDRRKQLFGAFSNTGKAVKLEELEGAEDGDPDGDSATAEGERYYGLLNVQIRRNYDLSTAIPQHLRHSLKARVVVTIGRRGELTRDPKIVASSGNNLFDMAVISAVKKTAPFSPPPDHLRAEVGDGVTMEFTP